MKDHDHSHEHDHSHDHDHSHEHEHDHSHSHEHDHSHEHEHDHSHDHSHEGDSNKKTIPNAIILKYMLDHNLQHVKDAEEFASKLKSNGQDEAAALILEAVTSYEEGNKKMSAALDSLNKI